MMVQTKFTISKKASAADYAPISSTISPLRSSLVPYPRFYVCARSLSEGEPYSPADLRNADEVICGFNRLLSMANISFTAGFVSDRSYNHHPRATCQAVMALDVAAREWASWGRVGGEGCQRVPDAGRLARGLERICTGLSSGQITNLFRVYRRKEGKSERD